MNRRNVLLALSGAVTTTALLAVPRRTLHAQPATQVVTTTPIDGTEYRRRTLEIGSLALQSSELAVKRAVDPRVREFGQFEIDEQISMAQVLNNTSDANPPPMALDPARAGILQTLTAATGHAFDVSYVQVQMQGHQELLAVQDAYLQSSSRTTDLEHIAVLARATITMHLTMLRDLETELRA